MVGQDDGERGPFAPLPAPDVQDVRETAGAQGAPFERHRDGDREFGGPVVVEQGQQALRVQAQGLAARGQPLE